MKRKPIYGLLAEFETPEELLAAAHRAHSAGYRKIYAFTPMPIEGLAEAVGFEHPVLPAVVFTGGLIGGLTGFFMCYYANVISFPLIIGGRPFNTLPRGVLSSFFLTVLFGAPSAGFWCVA